MIKFPSSQVGLVCLQMPNTLKTFFESFWKLSEASEFPEASENFGSFRNFVTRFGMQDLEPRRFWNILRTTAIKRKSVSYIIFGMGPKTVPVVKNLPNFSEIWEDVPRFPKISEVFRNFRNFDRKGRSARYIPPCTAL